MESVHQWGIEFIIAIQQIHGPLLDGIFRAITFLGGEEFYLIIIPLIFWCIDYRLGCRLAFLFLFSSWINVNLKDLFQQPRPFEINESLKLSAASGYGLPSGHAQASFVIWSSIAFYTRKFWLWITATVLIILIAFSRIYLGVHFPTDILAGWLVGFILIFLYIALESVIKARLINLKLNYQILLAIIIPIVLLLFHPGKGTASSMGTLAGVGIGIALINRYLNFSTSGFIWKRAIRFIIGICIVLVLYLGLKVILPDEESSFYIAFRFIQYGLIGIWVSFGAPWLFKKLRLFEYQTS